MQVEEIQLLMVQVDLDYQVVLVVEVVFGSAVLKELVEQEILLQ